MSVAEYMEMIKMTGDSIGLHAMNAIAILFAYITAMYLAGKSLSTLQVTLATSLFTVFYFFPTFSAINNLENTFLLTDNFYLDYPGEASRLLNQNGSTRDLFVNPLMIAFFLAWMAGLLFMYDVRRKK